MTIWHPAIYDVDVVDLQLHGSAGGQDGAVVAERDAEHWAGVAGERRRVGDACRHLHPPRAGVPKQGDNRPKRRPRLPARVSC